MSFTMKLPCILSSTLMVLAAVGYQHAAAAFSPSAPSSRLSFRTSKTTTLNMGLFDGWSGMGSGKDRLDEEWEKQQQILADRRKPKSERDAYFASVEKTRREASQKQNDMWAWQTKKYEKGEDPINEWRKRRESGQISDLNDQYGDPKEIGGIPLPMASFGVGGEFGLGGKWDNGGRFDLRLPYADQGYVDDDADVMGKLGSFFGGGGNKKKKAEKKQASAPQEQPKTKGGWPW